MSDMGIFLRETSYSRNGIFGELVPIGLRCRPCGAPLAQVPQHAWLPNVGHELLALVVVQGSSTKRYYVWIRSLFSTGGNPQTDLSSPSISERYCLPVEFGGSRGIVADRLYGYSFHNYLKRPCGNVHRDFRRYAPQRWPALRRRENGSNCSNWCRSDRIIVGHHLIGVRPAYGPVCVFSVCIDPTKTAK